MARTGRLTLRRRVLAALASLASPLLRSLLRLLQASAGELEALRGEAERRLVAVTTAVEARAGMTALTPDPAPPGRRASVPESLPPP